MVIVPKERDDILLLDRVKKLLTPARLQPHDGDDGGAP